MALFSNLDKYKKKIAFIETSGNFITYSKLIEDLLFLEKINISGPIILVASNNYFSLLVYIYCIRKKITLILLDNKIKKEDLIEIIKNYKPYNLVIPTLFDIKKNLSNVRYIYENDQYIVYKFYKNKNLKTKINLLLPTSGSMGKSKFVMLTNSNLLSNTESITKYLKIKSKEISITTMPPSYSYMLSVINTYINSGAAIVVNNYSVLQKDFWKILNDFKVSNFNGVPYIYEIIMRIGLEKLNTGYIKKITQAGGRLDKKIVLDILNFCSKSSINFTLMYGQTEASPRISYLEHKFIYNKPESIGKVIPSGKMWLVNSNNKLIKKPHLEGEIVYKGKNVYHGYANRIQDIQRLKKNDFKLYTGDIGKFDEDNFFYITSRKKRIIKIIGYRISLEDLEGQLSSKNFKTICIGKKNQIIIYAEKLYNKKRIINLASKITNLNSKFFTFIFLNKIPRTTSNKINYKYLDNYND